MKCVVLLLALWLSPAWAANQAVLRWGADLESGAPFAFKDPSDVSKMMGFELEIVQSIAYQLGRKLEFYQNHWDGLIQGLQRRDYDLVVNGLEITPDRAKEVQFSTPYYITSEVLAVRKDVDSIQKLEDLRDKRVGTLTSSMAQRILRQQTFKLEVVSYAEEIHLYNDLALGRVDAVLIDEPIAIYYAKTHPDLKLVGEHIGRIEYGVATRFDDPEFSRQVNEAILKMIHDGTLRTILEKWGLWNRLTASAWGASVEPNTPPTAYQNYIKSAWSRPEWKDRLNRYSTFLPLLVKGAWMTLQISILSMALAMLVGLLTAVSRLYGPAPLRWLALSYVEVFRGTPLLIQLYLIFYGFPHLGIKLDPFTAAVIGLGLNYGACEAENYRAGILSIPKAQMDASQALGMSRRQSLRHIILPQAMRVVIPPVTNDFIALLKDSSLVSVITMVELTAIYGQLASAHFDYLGIGLLVAAVYFLVGLPFVRMSRNFESNLNAHQRKYVQR